MFDKYVKLNHAFICKLDGVHEQIDEYLLQSFLIRHHFDTSILRVIANSKSIGILILYFAFKLNVIKLNLISNDFLYMLYAIVKIKFLNVKSKFIALQLIVIKEIMHYIFENKRARFYDFQLSP